MDKEKILILGASGFIGNAIYKELCSYFDTYGTYFSNKSFGQNKQFFSYNLQEDDIFKILETVQPQLIISSLRGDFNAQIQAHQHIIEYLMSQSNCKLYFISSANVFDAYSQYPSYEYDKTLSLSIYGRLKIKIENMLLRLPKEKMGIIRIPMVFGKLSPRIKEIKTLLENKEPIEVFPNLIINVTHDNKLTQQLHYLINRNKNGIFHLGSKDLVHHEEFIHEIVKKISGLSHQPLYKRVFTTNEDRYLAVLPKANKLPKNLQVTYQEIIDYHTF